MMMMLMTMTILTFSYLYGGVLQQLMHHCHHCHHHRQHSFHHPHQQHHHHDHHNLQVGCEEPPPPYSDVVTECEVSKISSEDFCG